MKKLKKPTTAILMATLIFSNIQLAPIYGNEIHNIGENSNKQIIEIYENDTQYENGISKENEEKAIINIPDITLKEAINRELGKHKDSDIRKRQRN